MSEWRTTTIGEVLTLQRGIDITRVEQRPGSVPVVSSGGISSYHDTAAVSGPGVVIGRKGALGTTFYLDCDYWPHDTTLWVKDFKGSLPRFVYYFFLNLDVKGLDVGSANPTLNRNHVHPLATRWPERQEQERIAAILGALDDKIAVNGRIAVTSSYLALALGRQAFETEPGHEVSMSDCAHVTKGVSYRSDDLTGDDGVLISLKCVGRDGQFQPGGAKPFKGECKSEQVLHDGEIVVAQTDLTQRAEVIGRPSRVVNLGSWSRMVASLDLAIVRPENGLTNEVIFALLSSQQFHDHALSHCNGTTVLHMNARALPTFRFTKPSDEVISRVSSTMRPLFKRSDQARRENQSLAELRNALLPKLMSGEIRVREAERIVGDAT